eukprot:gnl/MRDRNA2_/MRDRNA2_99523_c0_seq1.p1 gnl/MRDRNA2_/MRDRNA2_99523_c0~~gnl/MRDRNA2_/MRDRNA2_99523_c0_seq1.p1  ORF type:complete len:144 (-),score=30.43 gnl/MRDRNA2_/MRDRNA2_99523_c0_seq1:56-487(-)
MGRHLAVSLPAQGTCCMLLLLFQFPTLIDAAVDQRILPEFSSHLSNTTAAVNNEFSVEGKAKAEVILGDEHVALAVGSESRKFSVLGMMTWMLLGLGIGSCVIVYVNRCRSRSMPLPLIGYSMGHDLDVVFDEEETTLYQVMP